MSFDLGIWFSDIAPDAAEARAIYRHLCGDWVVIARSATFDAFLAELAARFPEELRPPDPAAADEVPGIFLVTGEDLHRSPAVAVQTLAGGGFLVPNGFAIALPTNFGATKDTVPAIYALAAAHGLVVYDPQRRT